MRDLPALWRGDAWRADLEGWLLPALEAAGRRPSGPVVEERVMFWSAVLSVETDGGKVWVKENAPSQAFEAGLVEVVAGLVPGLVAPVVAVDPARGRLATADLGVPLWHDETVPPVEDWVAVVGDYASAQRRLVEHEDALLATGLSRFPSDPDDVLAWVQDLVEALRALPEDDARRLTADEEALVRAGLPRLRDDAAALAASGLPDALQHNDLHLGNAFRREGGAAFIDLGDALWTHPLTAARIPVWTVRNRYGAEPAAAERVLDAFLEPWTDLADEATLRALVGPADRLSCLHRAVSWWRLQSDVPPEVVDEPFRRAVPEWLVDATAPDPYSSGVDR